MGTHLRVLSKSYPMNTTCQGLYGFKNISVPVVWTKVASALEVLTHSCLTLTMLRLLLSKAQGFKEF